MTNAIAVGLVIALASLFAADQLLWGGHLPLAVARRFVTFVEWVRFWG